MSERAKVAVSIIAFAADHQPPIIEFLLRDAFGEEWRFHDKEAIVSLDYLDENSSYPVDGSLRCTVLKRYVDETGRALVVIDSMFPDSVDSLGEEHVFTVADDQVLLETR